MASIARNASISRPPCSLQCLGKTQTRCLSTSRPHFARELGETRDVMKFMPRQQAQSTRMKNLRRSDIPTDLGLVPNTYIRPCGLMPSWFKSPVLRAQLEFLYFKQSITDFGNAVYIARWGPKDPLTNKRKKMPMELRERCMRARDLHTLLYKTLAKADKRTLNQIACSGLANEQGGIMARNLIEGVEPRSWMVKYSGWVLSPKIQFWLQLLIPSYFKAIHVVADRWASIPIGPGIMMRQVILRVDSKQTVVRQGSGSQPETKKLREYVVIQKTMLSEEARDPDESKDQRERDGWMIWGTLPPTDTEGALEIRNVNRTEQGSMADRIRNIFPGMS